MPKLIPQNQSTPNFVGQPTQTKKEGGYFWVTYTKSKVNSDGSTTTYSGRTSGWYNGSKPTESEAMAAVNRRNSGHKILNEEGYDVAILDEYSTSKAAIRGREQNLIDYYGGAQAEGGKSRNKIRAISRVNENRIIYQAAAIAEFGTLPNNNPVDNKQ